MCIWTETRYTCGAMNAKLDKRCSHQEECLPHIFWTHYSLDKCKLCTNGKPQPQLGYNISGLPSIPIASSNSCGQSGYIANPSGAARSEDENSCQERGVERDADGEGVDAELSQTEGGK